METEVLVVGAGPTGLLLANELALAGVRAAVVEQLTERSQLSRAGGLQPRSAEVLDLRGLLQPLLDRGLAEPAGQGGHFAALPVPLTYAGWDTRHPYVVAIAQARLEAYLEERLAEQGVQVLRGTAVTALAQDAEGVTVTAGGQEHRAAYVAACDGAHSTVRKLLGVPFPGRPGTMSAVLADVALEPNDRLPGERGHFSQHVQRRADRWGVLTPLEDGIHRFIFGGPEQLAVARETPVTAPEVQHALDAVYGAGIALQAVRAASRFSDAVRQVERYREGRVLLAGDAAHIHSPMGGQGTNLGLQDAFNLGWKLAAEVQGRAPEGLLDTYHGERHPVAARVLRSTMAQAVLNRSDDEDAMALRAIFIDLMRLPQVDAHLSGLVSGLDIRYEMPGAPGHQLVGRRMPDLDLPDGRRVSDLLHRGRGVLLERGPAARHDPGQAVDHVVAAAGTGAAPAVLIRPDGYVAWAEGAGDLDDALARWFTPRPGPPPPRTGPPPAT